MHYFNYKDGFLHCEEVSLRDLAARYGTPLYVYSFWTLVRHYNAYMDAFGRKKHILCYAVKANTSGAILKTLADIGAGADVISGGELFRALAAGIPGERIVYAGVGKTRAEIEYALRSNILMFNVESSQELEFIDTVAGDMEMSAPVALRVNPAVDPGTHAYVATGLKKSKFGVAHEQVLDHYQLARELQNISLKGIHMHIGSQITEVGPFKAALEKISELLDSLRKSGIFLEYLDIGGGLGITYDQEDPPPPAQLARSLQPILDRLDMTLVTEPGRLIVGNAGVLVTRVLYTKTTPEKHFIIVDAGMNDLMRPSLYGSFHEIKTVESKERPTVIADVVGPICESGDFFAKGRDIPAVSKGDLLAIMSAGAYGFSMSSNYNSRTRPAEVLIKDEKAGLIRQRETYDDLVEREEIPSWLK